MEGKCHCGRVAYRIERERLDDVAVCHCEDCRRSTGGTHVTWATVPLETFCWLNEAPREYHSSTHGTRFFCPTCGAQIALFTTRAPHSMDVTVGTLERPAEAPPNRHIWLKAKLPWVNVEDGLAREDGETL